MMWILIIYPEIPPIKRNWQIVEVNKIDDALAEIVYPTAQYRRFNTLEALLQYLSEQ